MSKPPGEEIKGPKALFADSPLADPRQSPKAELRWRGELPHLEKGGGTYFVTFCLAGAVRHRATAGMTTEIDPLAVGRSSEPVTAGVRVSLTGEAGSAVEAALLHFNGARYGLHAWCVMPDHVHVVACPFGEYRLAEIIHSWKSFTAKVVNRLVGREGVLWEREYFDHLVRSAQALGQFVHYTEENPVTAGFAVTPRDWPLSSARLRG
jgi:REP element-mobilizing transposase RayT